MGSRLGRRVISFANLPIKLMMPSSFTNITEIALKTIPSASKVEIKRVLESVYGFEVEKVETLNREGKKKKRGGVLFARPDYKKAYVTLRHPLSLSPDLFPIRAIEEERERVNKEAQSIVDEGETKKHWLHEKVSERFKPEGERGSYRVRGRREAAAAPAARKVPQAAREGAQAKFPWSSMRSVR